MEVDQETVTAVVNRYMAWGGTYIETARGYGKGASERKLGRALAGRDRSTYVLASKSGAGKAEDVRRNLEATLEALGTDYLDLYFFHGVSSGEALDRVCRPGGALEAFEQARDEGLVRGFGLSSHWPETYLEAARRLPLQAALLWGNYLDFCNFPEIPREVLPALREQGVGILFMKPVGDGYLYRSPEQAFGYALGFEPDGIVSGFNSLEMLELDVGIIQRLHDCPPDPAIILRDAVELGTYVCRQCEPCSVLPGSSGVALKRIFELEGKVDRQMDDLRVSDTGQYALRERLKGWFGTATRARELYRNLPTKAPDLAEKPFAPCRYGLTVTRKLTVAHEKLVSNGYSQRWD